MGIQTWFQMLEEEDLFVDWPRALIENKLEFMLVGELKDVKIWRARDDAQGCQYAPVEAHGFHDISVIVVGGDDHFSDEHMLPVLLFLEFQGCQKFFGGNMSEGDGIIYALQQTIQLVVHE